jgi:hypothetical protein
MKSIAVTRFFDGHYELSSNELNIDALKPRISNIVEKLKDALEILTQLLHEHMKRHVPFESSRATLEEIVVKFLANDFSDPNIIEQLFNTLYGQLRGLPNLDQQIVTDIEKTIVSLGEIKSELISTLGVSPKSKIPELLPRFLYFPPEVSKLPDSVKAKDYLENKGAYGTLQNLSTLTGLDIEKLLTMSAHGRRRTTREASAEITGMVNEYWTQEKVTVTVDVSGDEIFTQIEDDAGGSDPPSNRSDGFQWYLAFYINFMAGSQGELRNRILLLDNPGLPLHPQGQKDLLRTLNKISDNNQIILATHSPFLIDRENLDRLRIAKKRGRKVGTKIDEKWHVTDYDALEPIRAALGIALADAMFGGKNNLVVEGPSDYYLLAGTSNLCQKLGRTFLDFSEISVVPIGGAEKVPYYVLILAREKLKHVILLDNDTEGRKVAKDLVVNYDIKEKTIVMVSDADPKLRGTDVELEGLLAPEFYNNAVNQAYQELLDKKGITVIKLADLSDQGLVTKRYADYFAQNTLGGFDKVLVAKKIKEDLTEKTATEEAIGKESLDKFERLFGLIRKKLE